MIEIRTERSDGARIVRVVGSFGPDDDPAALVARLSRDAGSGPLVVDLAGLEPVSGPEVRVLLAALGGGCTAGVTAIVHPDLEARRLLRAASRGIPVAPSTDLVLGGRFAAAMVAERRPATT
jgi:hypothetical protein